MRAVTSRPTSALSAVSATCRSFAVTSAFTIGAAFGSVDVIPPSRRPVIVPNWSIWTPTAETGTVRRSTVEDAFFQPSFEVRIVYGSRSRSPIRAVPAGQPCTPPGCEGSMQVIAVRTVRVPSTTSTVTPPTPVPLVSTTLAMTTPRRFTASAGSSSSSSAVVTCTVARAVVVDTPGPLIVTS